MTQIVTTNLRINKPDWLQIKAMAGEKGMSVNAFINYLIRKVSTREMLGEVKREKQAPIWNLPEMASKKNKPMGMSREDKAIYG